MNFDWTDQDQVGGTEWGDFNESEDHIVPYPKDTAFTFEDCHKKPCNLNPDIAQSSGKSSGAKNEFLGSSLQISFRLNANEFSDQRLDMDTWPDLPALNTELSTGELSSLNKPFSSLAGTTAEHDCESELFGEGEAHDSFLDSDWNDIGDFGDLDRIFRDDSIFVHNTVANVDDFLPQPPDVMDNSMQSIPMPDLPLSRDQDQGCSSFQSVEHSSGKRKSEHKTADILVESAEQAIHHTHNSNQLMEKDDRKKKLLKTQKKAEDRSSNKATQTLSGPWPQNTSQNQPFPGLKVQPVVIPPSQALYAPAFAQPRHAVDTKPTESTGMPSQFMFSQHGYPAYPFPGLSVLQHVQGDANEHNDVSVGHYPYPDAIKYPDNSNTVPEGQLKPLAMTPQEKIEKLRRRQQAHAMLAIQQQQQQFSHQNIGPQMICPQVNFLKNSSQDAISTENENTVPLSGLNVLSEQDESQRTSALIDDNALKQTIFFHLQDAVRKLDNRVRLCIRDSLFRLARSSFERQNIGDINSTNITTRVVSEVPVIGAGNDQKRWTTFQDAETYTNPIDRTVAHLIFHKPLEPCTRTTNDELPQSNFFL